MAAGALFSAARYRTRRSLGAEQIHGSDLDTDRAECNGRRDAFRICNAPSSDNRAIDLLDNLRQRAKVPTFVLKSPVRNIPRCPPASSPCAMMASTPCASSQRASSTVSSRRMTLYTHPFTRATNSRRQAEMETNHGWPEFAEEIRGLGTKRHSPRPFRIVSGSIPTAGRRAQAPRARLFRGRH